MSRSANIGVTWLLVLDLLALILLSLGLLSLEMRSRALLSFGLPLQVFELLLLFLGLPLLFLGLPCLGLVMPNISQFEIIVSPSLPVSPRSLDHPHLYVGEDQ